MVSPFEQFELVSIVSVLTNSSIIGLGGLLLFVLLVVLTLREGSLLLGSRWLFVLDSLLVLVLRMLRESVGKTGERYVGQVLSLFMIIMLLNLVGMIPYSYSITGQLVVTFTLGLGVWIGKLVVGIREHGVRLLGMFLPEGVPFMMVPFFVFIEIIGFIVPVISLSVRLFANMMSGHVLLKVLFGFTWLMLVEGGLLVIGEMLPLGVLLLLVGLETCIGMIQAYVFTLLTCIYLGDMVSGGH